MFSQISSPSEKNGRNTCSTLCTCRLRITLSYRSKKNCKWQKILVTQLELLCLPIFVYDSVHLRFSETRFAPYRKLQLERSIKKVSSVIDHLFYPAPMASSYYWTTSNCCHIPNKAEGSSRSLFNWAIPDWILFQMSERHIWSNRFRFEYIPQGCFAAVSVTYYVNEINQSRITVLYQLVPLRKVYIERIKRLNVMGIVEYVVFWPLQSHEITKTVGNEQSRH